MCEGEEAVSIFGSRLTFFKSWHREIFRECLDLTPQVTDFPFEVFVVLQGCSKRFHRLPCLEREAKTITEGTFFQEIKTE